MKGRCAENVRNSEAPGARSEGLKRSGNSNQGKGYPMEAESYSQLKAALQGRVWGKQHSHFTLLPLSDLLLTISVGKPESKGFL